MITEKLNDLTLLYYTSHTLWEPCAENVRNFLLLNAPLYEMPLISVSQKRLSFGHNICVGEIGRSYYNCYKQIYIGAQAVRTKYVACVEDDTLYCPEHFFHRPTSDDTFAYNANMWFLEEKGYWGKKDDYGMCGCIASTKLLIDTLKPRFDKFPDPIDPADRKGQRYWQEPGRCDRKFGIPDAKVELFKTQIPLLTFNYFKALGGKKMSEVEFQTASDLPSWGNGIKLWNKFWTGKI